MSTPEPVNQGPCTEWITGADVDAVCTAIANSGDPSVYDDAALAATQVLFDLSGRQFPGECERTVRPCVPGCGCWPDTTYTWGVWYPWPGWWWNGPSGPQAKGRGCCGCISEVKLAGYPVRQVTQVLIDGAVIPAEDWRLDQHKYLVYMDDTDGRPRRWPACQNLARDDTEEGTFSVTYTYGKDPPEIALLAATELACQIATAAAGGECSLPPGTTRVIRQGITVDLGKLRAELMVLPLVSLFLQTYNPTGLRRRASVWSPDIAPYGRTVGP